MTIKKGNGKGSSVGISNGFPNSTNETLYTFRLVVGRMIYHGIAVAGKRIAQGRERLRTIF